MFKILTAKYESGTTAEYFTGLSNSVVRITYEGQPDNSMMTVPANADNMDYQEILAWVAEGNTIEPADE